MIIQGPDFRLIFSESGVLQFDLELLQTINKGKKNERSEFKLEGYAYSLERVIKKIVQYRLDKKEETVDLKEFLKQFKEQVNIIHNLCKV